MHILEFSTWSIINCIYKIFMKFFFVCTSRCHAKSKFREGFWFVSVTIVVSVSWWGSGVHVRLLVLVVLPY